MKITTKRDVVRYKLELSNDEAYHLMHVCWFALDYKAEKDKIGETTMTEGETDVAQKLKEFFENETNADIAKEL